MISQLKQTRKVKNTRKTRLVEMKNLNHALRLARKKLAAAANMVAPPKLQPKKLSSL